MKEIIHLDNISAINKFVHQGATRHPLVAIVDFSKVEESIPEQVNITCNFYSVMYKNYCINQMKYGRENYDFQEGSLVCLSPNQVITLEGATDQQQNMIGWGLFFHPDLVRGTSLQAKMKDYTFFSYHTSEALHLSEKEEQVLNDCIKKISSELQENIDHHSQTLIVSNIELLLNYCARYYGRQFITRKTANKGIVATVDSLLHEYFRSTDSVNSGLPTVKSLAEQVHLSPNYLGDLLKRETGMNAQERIHYHLIEKAKNMLTNTDQSVSEIAYQLGFEYPQYFSKLFKSKTGQTPLEYRKFNN